MGRILVSSWPSHGRATSSLVGHARCRANAKFTTHDAVLLPAWTVGFVPSLGQEIGIVDNAVKIGKDRILLLLVSSAAIFENDEK